VFDGQIKWPAGLVRVGGKLKNKNKKNREGWKWNVKGLVQKWVM